ncbi:TetR/AcrR family transcriptional regulator [Dactylosporangium sp. CA-233914]|uniref:TetR/AcrR family transcriptional regulator n=1 Tax=Dactylosporangium sp. CA-233914 TaxID=3239934 RepID=UPI003D8F0E16
MPPKTSAERLTRTAVAERALLIGDREGLDAITIRRLAQELGVTPMALYWHFKNKDELLLGLIDHVLADVRADRAATAPRGAMQIADPWPVQLRAMVEALVRAMRAHPCLPDLLHASDKKAVESFTRATDDALALLERAGFTLEEGYWVASYLLHATIGLVHAQPGCPLSVPPEQVGEWLRQQRIQLQSLSAERYPQMVRLAETYQSPPDLDQYFAFGIDLVMGAVEKMAAGRPVAS